MIYSNACYAPGAGEGQHEPADRGGRRRARSAPTAARRWPTSAPAPTSRPTSTRAPRTSSARCSTNPTGRTATSSRPSRDFDGRRAGHACPHASRRRRRDLAPPQSPTSRARLDYWYAFAGDPTPAFAGGAAAEAATAAAPRPSPRRPVDGIVTGMASSYSESIGWEGRPTVALPLELGGGIPDGEPQLRARLRGPLRRAARRRLLPVLRRHAPTSASRTCRTRRGAWSPTCRSRRGSSRSRSPRRRSSRPSTGPPELADAQPTLTRIVWWPRAPSGAGRVRSSVWTSPSPSVARTRSEWSPGVRLPAVDELDPRRVRDRRR